MTGPRVDLRCDRNTNERIRELLRFYGLRTSLIRLKVIDALRGAAKEKRFIGVHGVHAYLGLPLVGICRYDITLSVSSVASLTASLLRAITPATKPSIKASTAMLELVSTG